MTRHPAETWMEQMARNVTDESTGCLRDIRYVLHDWGDEALRLLCRASIRPNQTRETPGTQP
jgi:putative transposase